MEREEMIEREQNLDLCFESQFSGKAGESVLKDLERECGLNDICFEKDARFGAFLLGRRSIALYIKDRMSGAFSKRKENNRQENYNRKETDNG